MGNDVEKMEDPTDVTDHDSTAAVGPGPLPPILSASASGEQSDDLLSSSVPSPPNPGHSRHANNNTFTNNNNTNNNNTNNHRRRQNRIVTNHSCDADSAAAVFGPSLTMNTTTTSKEENTPPATDYASSMAVWHQASASSLLSNNRPSSPPIINSIAFLTTSSSYSGSIEKEKNGRNAIGSSHYNNYNPNERYTGKGSSLVVPTSPNRQRVGSPTKLTSLHNNGATGSGTKRRGLESKSGSSSAILSPVNVGPELEIEEGTPAAEALEANAKVRVTKVGKAARFMNAQAIRRLIKQNKLWNRRGTGNKRGKPPRVPQISRRWSDNDVVVDTVKAELKQIAEDDEDGEDESSVMKKSGSGSTSGRRWSGIGIDENHPLDSPEFSSKDFRKLAKRGDEDDPDATHVAYDVEQPPTITLHDRHGKKQEIKMFGKMKERSQRRKERRESRNYVKGRVIQEEHELYTLSIAVMLGLRYAIYQTHRQLENDKQDKRFWLDSEEFMRMEKYVFRPDGRHNTPPHKLGHTFKFKDYSPVPFAYIRRMFGINEYEFIHSVCGNANFIEFISNAKSGQFFFYSSDGKYMIKTMTNTESKFLRRILPHYFRHCAQNPSTLMTKFLGMYRVKLYHLQRNVKFIVMNSVFDTDKMISSFYDLKGSRIEP